MARQFKSYATILSIPANQLPAQGEAAEPWWSADDGVGGKQAASVRASLNCATQGGGTWDTVVEALVPGSEGNTLKVKLTADAAVGAGVSVTYTPATGIVNIHYEGGVSTVLQVETAIDAVLTGGVGSGGGDKQIRVKTPGTPATVLAGGAAFAAAPLAGGISSEGHLIQGAHADIAVLYFTPTNWGAITQVELVVARNVASGLGAAASKWGAIEPTSLINRVTGKYIDILNDGRIVIKNTLVAGKTVAVPLEVYGAQRLRIGLRAADANVATLFACTAGLELLQKNTYA